MNTNYKHRMGWRPDLPDHRDYTIEHPTVSPLLAKMGISSDQPKPTHTSIDLRKWCSPIEDQENLGSCTAQAGVGLMEYFERKAFGNYINGSRLFLYKATRNLAGEKGDAGAEIRTTMGTMVTLGICPEKYLPYDIRYLKSQKIE